MGCWQRTTPCSPLSDVTNVTVSGIFMAISIKEEKTCCPIVFLALLILHDPFVSVLKNIIITSHHLVKESTKQMFVQVWKCVNKTNHLYKPNWTQIIIF